MDAERRSVNTARVLALRLAGALAGVGLVVLTYTKAFETNATTVALTFSLLVLFVATFWGLAVAITASVASVVAFNYFFLPPVGTLTIQDPQNRVALAVFLVTAITASHLSAQAQRRAEEARKQRDESSRLYDFGRAILVNEDIDRTAPNAAADFARIFRLQSAAFYGVERFSADTTLAANDPMLADFASVANSGSPRTTDSWRIVPVRMGLTPVGSVGLQSGGDINSRTIDSVANLFAIALERKFAISRAAALETARQNEELRSALLDGLAHDLKTPLTAIKASATALLAKSTALPSSVGEYLAIIDEETDRLDRAVSEAVETARIAPENLTLRSEHADLAEIVSDIAAERPRYRERVHGPDAAGPMPAIVDRDLIRLALRQVIDNAVKYSPPDQLVNVDLSHVTGSLQIRVADRGAGLNDAERNRVFEKFYRGTVGRQVAGGSGMGLAVAKTIVQAHGGDITIENREGGGTVFVITLPDRLRT